MKLKKLQKSMEEKNNNFVSLILLKLATYKNHK